MKVTDQGHTYELENVEGGTQTLQFIRKERGPAGAEADTLKTVINGVTTEEVITVLIDRLEFLHSRLPDDQTQAAITSLKAALDLLEARTKDRQARNVEGTDTP